MLNHQDNIELGKSIVGICQHAGLDVRHPAVQHAMKQIHVVIVQAMPHTSDAERAKAVAERKDGLLHRITQLLPPEHRANGGPVELPGNNQPTQTLQSQGQVMNDQKGGQTNLATGGYVKKMASGGQAEDNSSPDETDAENEQNQDGSESDPADIGGGLKAIGNSALNEIKSHPFAMLPIVAGLNAVPGADESGVGEAADAAEGGALEGELADGANTIRGEEPLMPGIRPGVSMDLPPAEQQAEQDAAEETGGGGGGGSGKSSLVRRILGNIGKGADVLGVGGVAYEAGKAGLGKISESHPFTNAVGYGAADAAAHAAGAGNSGVPVFPTKVASMIGDGGPNGTIYDQRIASAINPEVRINATQSPNAFNNSQNELDQVTSPITGLPEGLNQAEQTAQHYADEQTPQAMANAQQYNNVPAAALLGASLSSQGIGVAGNIGGASTALNDLANLPTKNLQAQQQYGNAGLTQLNRTNYDVTGAQGQAIGNALAGSGPGRTAAQALLGAQQQLAQDTQDFNVIHSALQKMGKELNPAIQALVSGSTPQQIFGQVLQNATPEQRSAVLSIYALLQNHPELKSEGIVDGGSLMTVMQNALQKEHIAVSAAQSNLGIQSGSLGTGDITSGGVTTPPRRFAQGGSVNNDETADELQDELGDEVADQDADNPMGTADILRKAFGMVPKNAQITQDQVAPVQDSNGNVVGAEQDIEAQSPPSGQTGSAMPAQPQAMKDEPSGSSDIPSMVAQQAEQMGVPPQLALAVAKTESNFDPNAIDHNTNGTTDYGPMQVNSSNYSQGEDTSDVGLNIQKGVQYLKQCLIASNGDPRLAAYKYNHGINANISPQNAANDPYVMKVMHNMSNAG